MERLTNRTPKGAAVYSHPTPDPEGWQNNRISVLNKCCKYEEMQEKIEQRIAELKASSNYPHNFKGQMVEDFEWVLSLLD